MKFTLTLSALAVCSAPFLSAQSDQSSPQTYQEPQNTMVKPVTHPTESTAKPDPKAKLPAEVSTVKGTGNEVAIADDQFKNQTTDKLAGSHVMSSDGRDLGKVKDFLIDTQTGKADFAFISSGGIAGLGDKLRLVPVSALQQSADKNQFTLDVREEHWKQLAAISEDEFKAGVFTMTDAQRRQIAQNFAHRTDLTPDSGFFTADLTGHLIRASALKGRPVQSGNERFGKIDTLVVDLGGGQTKAVVDPNQNFTGTHKKLLVPFSAFSVGDDKRPQINTLLSRADFNQPNRNGSPSIPVPQTTGANKPAPAANAMAANSQNKNAPDQKATQVAANNQPKPAATNPNSADQAGRVAANAQPNASQGQNLTPTGQDSSDAIAAGTDPALIAAARAIRKSLDNDAALAQLKVQVVPENGRIVLRGEVADQKSKTAVIEKATAELKGWKYDDQISITK